MVQLQLYIEGQEVELFKDESIVLTQSIQDIRDISKIFTDYTKTFNVPASKRNNKIFKHFYNFNIVGFDARKKKDATLELNYKPFKQGKIKLEGVQLKNNEPDTYKITFYGNTVNLKDILGEDKLSGLTNLKYLNFDYTDANITAYMSDGKDVDLFDETLDNALIFPLITAKSRLIFDDTLENTDTIKNVNPLGSGSNVGVPLNELKPALRLYAIIKCIEVQYDGIEFSRDFFNTTNPDFYGLYLWLHNKEGLFLQDQEAQYPVANFIPVDAGISEISGWKSGSFVNEYNEQNANRELRIFINPDTNAPYNLVIKKDGEQFQKFDNLSGQTVNGVTSGVGANIEIPNGTYTFYIETQTVSSYTVDIRIIHTPKDIFSNKKDVLYRGSAAYTNAQTINIPSIMPDMTVMEFLTGLFKLFNLTAYQNVDGIIQIKTLDSYYSSSTKVWDITKYLDKTQNTIDSILPFKEIQFTYAGYGTFLAKNHKELAATDWGSLHYYDGNKFEGETYSVEIPFEHLKFERLYSTDNGVINTTTNLLGNTINQDSNIQYGYSVNETQDPYLGKPVIFYSSQGIAANVKVRSLDDQTISTVNNVYLPLNSTAGTLIGYESQSLNFNAEIDEWTRKPNNKSIFKTYYKSYVKDMMDLRKRITNVKAFLPMKIIHNLSLADKIIVFDDIYRINKISTNFETNLSDIELTNIFEEFTYKTLITVAGQSITVDFDWLTMDTIQYFADGDGNTDGFTIPDITTSVPSDIPSNDPQPVYEDEVVLVTPPKIQAINLKPATSTTVYMQYSVTELGKLINTPQIDEYGFFYSTDISKVVSNDVDILKATSGVTNIPFITNSATKFVLPTIPSYELNGLSHPTTVYYRFYGRTNTNSLYPKADAVSELSAVSTVTTATEVSQNAIFHVNYDLYLVGSATTTGNALCGLDFSGAGTSLFPLYELTHTGTGSLPVVGDFVRISKKNGTVFNSTYYGGAASFNHSWAASNRFSAFIYLDTANFSNYVIIVELATCTVKEIYQCP